jgi:hypothetical protein
MELYSQLLHLLSATFYFTNSAQPSSMAEWDVDGCEIPCLKMEMHGTAEKDAT